MKTSTTFKGAPKPYGATGHFNESRRHALQAKGIKTGHLADPLPAPAPKPVMPEKPKFNEPIYEGDTTRFPISDKIEIFANSRKMRNGFNHYARLYINGQEDVETKIHYINRTWESYHFQSVIRQAVSKSKSLSDAEKQMAFAYIDKDWTSSRK